MAELAGRQHGVVSLAQLRELGLGRGAVRWHQGGRLHRLHRDVYAVGHRVLRVEGRWMAAVLACGPLAVLSFRSAATLHELRARWAASVDVTVPGRTGRSRAGIRVHSGDRLRPDETTVVRGIPTTGVSRTILDLAAVLDRRGLERACEQAVRIGSFDLFALTAMIARHRGRRGVAILRTVLESWDDQLPACRSELEVRLLRLIAEAGIERPLVNRSLEVAGRRLEVDFHWPSRGLIVETDGRAYHDNPISRRRDAERDRALAAEGWSVLHLTWAEVTSQPTRTLATITRLLGSSGSQRQDAARKLPLGVGGARRGL